MTDKARHRSGGSLIEVHRPANPLFGLGAVYCVPAVAAFLATHGRTPAELLAHHAGGDWGTVSEADAAANDRALREGGMLRSCYLVEGKKVGLVTDSADRAGVRSATCILFMEK